ncbi:chloride channel protein [Roseofilum casamattae]|uniref:Chloride channel protein n=1 Tax=Roseofilum casamattae BLCC-M143 TaxID=3022442 RepID=A0ABT7BV70_9CYAN|nr:chloride channel protein [Roseofilum casamattae]MDJ1182346.1 chloride channel protein [Roseofilum casamattae BLCC-M143]
MPPLLLPKRRVMIAEACLIGLVSGCSAVLLRNGIGAFGSWRVALTQIVPAWIVLPVIGMGFGFLSGMFMERFAPETKGSGIAQVKAVLGGSSLPLNWRTATVKLISGLLSLSSGLTLGRQGPTVHIGAALAAEIARIFPTSPNHRRQMVAAGAAAGLAAGFNAPIAGMLFVLEELLHDMSELTLETAIGASFIGAVVSRLFGGSDLALNREVAASVANFSAPEIPAFVILGVLAGILGTLFNQSIITSLTLSRRLRLSLPARMALAGFISGLCIALLPSSFNNHAGLRQLLLNGDLNVFYAILAFAVNFVLTCVAYSAGTPGGLFAPTLTLGAALGYLVGIPLGLAFGLDPDTYALAGMGAFFSAVGKVPMTSIVIVFEITTDFNLVLPLMIVSVVAYFISSLLEKNSLYERLLVWNGIEPRKEQRKMPEGFDELIAEDVMRREVETLNVQLPFDEVVKAFSRSHHRGFPVVSNGRLVGIVTQSDLSRVVRDNSEDTPPLLQEFMTPDPVTIKPTDPLSEVVYQLNRYKLSRLPVIEGRRLVGIITRSDIIRAESDLLSGQGSATSYHEGIGPHGHGSYGLYQTRGPAVGKGRILVPIANPHTAALLLQMAGAIAAEQDCELECLQVILVSGNTPPDEARIDLEPYWQWTKYTQQLGEKLGISTHTQIRATHDVARTILETIKYRHATMLVMGWKGRTTTPGRIFGNVVDTLIRQAPCEVVLVKWAARGQQAKWRFHRWLLPLAGGPNAIAGAELLPGLIQLSYSATQSEHNGYQQTSLPSPEIQLCQVSPRRTTLDIPVVLEEVQHFLQIRLRGRSPLSPVLSSLDSRSSVTPIPRLSVVQLISSQISQTIIDYVRESDIDVLMMGASREGLLRQAIEGNLPEEIASGCDCTVILVRQTLSLTQPLDR